MSDSNPRVRGARAAENSTAEPTAESREALMAAAEAAARAAAVAVTGVLEGPLARQSVHLVVTLIALDRDGFLLTSSGGIASPWDIAEAEVAAARETLVERSVMQAGGAS